jgi:hypothetical protein
MVDQDRLAAARQDEQSTVVTTEWAVLWPGDPAQGGGIEPRGDEQDARRVARMNGGGGQVVCQTVTTMRSRWRVA